MRNHFKECMRTRTRTSIVKDGESIRVPMMFTDAARFQEIKSDLRRKECHAQSQPGRTAHCRRLPQA